MPYLLDTNAVIAIFRDTASHPARRVRQEALSNVAISVIVVHELFYGAFRSRLVNRNLARIDALEFQVLEFDWEDSRHAGEIRALLASRGTPIRPYDILIAGQAVARNMTLVTRNTSEFARVPGLRIENWEI